MIRHYRDLQVWQRSMKLVVVVYRLTEHFPKSEAYGLTNQIRRAAVSIPSNIAEGHARTNREFGRFLRIARGSMAELETQLEIAMHLEYLPRKQFDEISTELTSWPNNLMYSNSELMQPKPKYQQNRCQV